MPLYSEIEPYDTGMLKVSDLHTIFYEQSGKPDGKPAIIMHEGPGMGSDERDRRFFDPKVYRIVMFDQRGVGKSIPRAELKDNTTWDLVEDVEKLRKHLGIKKWVVFGGSWGSALSLSYSETHPDRVKALVIRGIFTLRRRELVWFYQDGASIIYPDAWEEYLKPIPEAERFDLIGAYYRRLTSDNEDVRMEAAKAWSIWEMTTSRIYVDHDMVQRATGDAWTQQLARIECHYFVNGGFFKPDGQLIKNADRIRHIPATIVQGRYDLVCPFETAWLLHKAFPEAEFQVVPDAGHSSKESGIQEKVLEACEKYKHL